MASSIVGFFAHLAILPAKEQQRIPFPQNHVLDFRNEDRVVPRLLRRLQPTFQVCQRAVQHRSSMPRAVKARPGLNLGVLVGTLRTRVVLGNCLLVLAEDIDPEALLGVQMGMGAGAVIHTDQHQHGIERNRRERVGRHAVHLAVEVNGDDRHPGGEGSHRLAEFDWIQGHDCRNVDCSVFLTTIPMPPTETCYVSTKIARATAYITMPGRCIIRGNEAVSPIMRSGREYNSAVPVEVCPGEAMSRDTALELIRCPDGDLAALLAAARAAKEHFKPGVITYSRKVFIPLTNLCRDYCGYCTFRRDPDDPGAHTMTPDEVLGVARAGENLGCTEALFSLGDKPELLFPEMRDTLRQLGYKSTLHYLEAMCELVLRETTLLPHPNPGLLSAEWVARLAAVSPSMGLMLETTNSGLLSAGRAHDNAPDKVPAKRLRTIEEAGKQTVPFTTGLLIGIGESMEDRVDTLLAIRDLHQRYGHIQEVIVQNFRVKPTIPMANWPEPTQGEMLRTVAVARLLLPEVNIQAPPNLSAPYYEELIDAGINDWGGISPLTPDFINPEKPWPHIEQLRLRTEAKGAVLRQRLPVYPEFVSDVIAHSGLLSNRLRAATGDDGLARRAA